MLASKVYPIIDKDIELIENSLNLNFDDSRRNLVLKEEKTCYIQACPGSGKTTALVAKLIIIANKLPEISQGICVLSHTNVARSEIEKGLTRTARKILEHPNFIGTIQSFIDRYIAIPAYIEKYKKRPKHIDNDIYFNSVKNIYKSSQRYNNYPFISQKREGGDIYLGRICYRFREDNLEICEYDNNNDIERNIKENNDKTGAYERILEFKNRVTNDGIITYYDALALADWYLDKYPKIAENVVKRFPLIFIDEMQDTNKYLRYLIDKIFVKNQEYCSIQFLGDNNQNLYNKSTDFNDSIKNIEENSVKLSSTYRLCPSITKLSQNVCEEKQDLSRIIPYDVCNNIECNRCSKCKNTLIFFDDSNIQNVLPTFAKIIKEVKEYKQWEGDNDVFKAVGAIGKENNNKNYYSIKSYCDFYSKDSTNISKLEHLNWYFELAIEDFLKSKICKSFTDNVINGITRYVNIQNNYKYSRQSFLQTLEDDYPSKYTLLRNKLAVWIELSFYNEDLERKWDQIKADIELITENFQKNSDKIQNFVRFEKYKKQNQDNLNIKNIFIDKESNIEIELTTINQVKGQTHDATILFETFFDGVSDLGKILDLICFKDDHHELILSKLTGTDINKRLPLVYVAMTRPKHLLCLAMNIKNMYQNTFNETELKLLVDSSIVENIKILFNDRAEIKKNITQQKRNKASAEDIALLEAAKNELTKTIIFELRKEKLIRMGWRIQPLLGV